MERLKKNFYSAFLFGRFFRIMCCLPMLHSEHDVIKLEDSVSPPLLYGFIWSTSNLIPSCGVLPQYWQVKLSLWRIVKRSLNLPVLSGRDLLFELLRGPGFVNGKLAAIKAFFQPKNLCSYTDLEGNPFKEVMFLPLTGCPKTIKASLNFPIKYSRERWYEPFVLIFVILTRFIKKSQYKKFGFFILRWICQT